MRILVINTVYGVGSTGRIAKGIKGLCSQKGIECKIAYRYNENGNIPEDTLTVSSWLDCHIHNRLSRWTMLQGCFSKLKTIKFLREVKKYAPDIIHLHNIHGSYINHKLLFSYIKKHNIKTVWTLHDCWALTGCCPHFDMVGCNRWMHQCGKCPQKESAYIDFSKMMLKNKKSWFSGVPSLTIVTPSKWLADLVKQSYLKEYPIQVIHNGINLDVFKPSESDFRKKYGLEDKKIILGVSFGWNEKKGLDVFLELSKRLDQSYQIVLVGTNNDIDAQLPPNIISIHRTDSQKNLAEIYTVADVFVNPTREDTFPTVNIEALACGTPVITFATGGSPEIIDNTCGCSVARDDFDALYQQIIHICENHPYSKENCLKKAQSFNMEDRFEEYVKLYKELL